MVDKNRNAQVGDTASLTLEDFSLSYGTAGGRVHALDKVSLTLKQGSVMGLVGESGSGKSSLVLALLGLAGKNATITAKRAQYEQYDLLADAESLRGRKLAMIFQDAAGALNPAIQIGKQIGEPLQVHMGMSLADAMRRAEELLAEVGIADPARVARAYPHQLSGGMKQRAIIAGALATEPDLLFLDEPTTALDVTVEAQIIALLRDLRVRRGLSMVFVSHNIGVISKLCDSLTVLYGGRVVEQGDIADVLHAPRHPYTKGLLAALPRLDGDRKAKLAPIPGFLPNLRHPPGGCNFEARCPFADEACRQTQVLSEVDKRLARCHRAAELASEPWPINVTEKKAKAPATGGRVPILEVKDLEKGFLLPRSGSLLEWNNGWPRLAERKKLPAVDKVNLSIRRGEILGVVGESGSGKTTLGRAILRLTPSQSGSVVFDGKDVPGKPDSAFRRKAQIVFQSSSSSLNPRRTVGQLLRRCLHKHGIGERGTLDAEVSRLLEQVRLPASYAKRYPHQLSGGEKQRVGLARALASKPEFVVCDEAVSALDVSVQAAVLNLLSDLKDELGVAYLFITHDIGVVAHIADRIAVMYRGAVVEEGPVDAIIDNPVHPYTKALIAAVPRVEPRKDASPEEIAAPKSGRLPGACRYSDRCGSYLGEICDTVVPSSHAVHPGHNVACHLLADARAEYPGRPEPSRVPASVQ